jgi:hypothetical protein
MYEAMSRASGEFGMKVMVAVLGWQSIEGQSR